VPLASSFYIERDTDRAFQAAIARRDGIILVKGPRQTGKTSLLARRLQQAREAGAAVVITDFQRFSSKHWSTLDTLFMALARSVTEQLKLNGQPENVWRDREGPNENFDRYIRIEVLEKIRTPVVWGLDEVDRVFSYEYRDDVFSLFRAWYNDRALEPAGPLNRLTLAIAYATEAHLFITDLNQSPFNVGTRLSLEDFNCEQVGELNQRYGSPLGSAETKQFHALVGGNPYLARCGLQEIASRGWDMGSFERQAVLDDGCYGDHLQRLLGLLRRDETLQNAVASLLQGAPNACTADSFYRLRSAGVILGSSPDVAKLRCQLYTNYLEPRLK